MSTDNFAANQIKQREGVQSAATQQMGRAQTQFTHEDMPQLISGIAASGQHYGTAGGKALGNAKRHYQDSQFGILSGATRALDELTMQQAYAASGLII
jgi:hypothetical protein